MIAALLLAVAPLPAELPLPAHAKVGEWVTFRLQDRGYWRIAAVAQEGSGVWLELDFGDHPALKAPMATFKLLVDRGAVTRAIVALGADRPHEIPPAELPRFFSRDKARAGSVDPSIAVKTLSAQPLLTPRGSVTATPVEVRLRSTVIKRLWLCDSIPLLKVAKIELPAIGYALEAWDWGADARPRLASNIPMEQNDTARIP